MKANIQTSNGIYTYEVKTFTLGSKRINRKISKDNLLDFRACLKDANITFGLLYGTLLGGIREDDFIAHDEDLDVFVFGKTIAVKKMGSGASVNIPVPENYKRYSLPII